MQFIPALQLLGFDRSAGPGARHPSFDGAWQARHEDVGRGWAAFCRIPGASLTLPAIEGEAELVVMCTSWSGIVEISAGEERLEVDTYAPVHTLRSVALPGSGRRDVRLRLLEQRNAASADREFWLHRLVCTRRPPWNERVTRLTPALELAEGEFGTFMTLRGDIGISHTIRTHGSWSPEQVALFRRLVGPGQTVIDVGANIGHHSVVLSGLVGATGQVITFEPQPFVHRVLESNLALNGCSNTVTHRLALGASSGEALMAPLDYEHDRWNVGGLGIVQAGVRGATSTVVQLRRLDDIVGTRDVDFIKCDAQGYDFEVLKGARRTLARCLPIVLVEVAPLSMPGGTGSYLQMYEMLGDLGYRLLDAAAPDLSSPPRRWTGKPEEWDLLALQERHLPLLGLSPD